MDKGGLVEQGIESKESFIGYLNRANEFGFSALCYATYFEFEVRKMIILQILISNNNW